MPPAALRWRRRDNNNYTVSQNKTPTQSFCGNFNKYEPILIILSLLQSVMNFGRSCYIIRHLTSNLLTYCLAKFECSTVQLTHDSYSIHKSDSCLFTVNVYRHVMFCIICMWITLLEHTVCSKYPQSAGTHVCIVHTTLSMDSWMTRCCNAVPSV